MSGGSAKQARRECVQSQRELEKRGHTVDCWFLDDVLQNHAGSGRFDALKFARRIAQKILQAKQAYDVVNLHAPWGCVYGLWRKFRRPQGAPPYVFTMHGSEEWSTYMMSHEHRLGRTDIWLEEPIVASPVPSEHVSLFDSHGGLRNRGESRSLHHSPDYPRRRPRADLVSPQRCGGQFFCAARLPPAGESPALRRQLD